MSAHTPGPWKIEPDLYKFYFQITSCKGAKVASCHAGSSKHTNDKSDELCANARLISAAPDLLEGLKECIGYFESDANRTINNWQSSDSSKADAYKKLGRAKKYRESITKATGASA